MPHLPPDSSPHPPYGAPDPQDPYAASYDPTSPQTPYTPTASPPPQPPSHLTYPWQPPAPAPQPATPCPRRGPAPGHRGDLRQLRGAYRRQRRVATLTALGCFTLFLLLSAFAPALMTGPVTGGLTTGLLAGLLQLPVMCLATVVYEITARRRLDRLAARLRTHLEREASRA
ncbi:hypothetical protein C9F11_17205 [Streptomyces sp. YIM 121038]|uniref:DUF485 domain-containing protein n=1 Tax=Streptomyces sp. YIM 121038 TaxID=2136401 RepID=UPI001110DD88|nr:DUF485 domain-containing protein [Streptomyces sp. YIM 121038]QCX77097.1 hypothetical protein C9F11_17205 [Streptomyces sp. YIM 121038]